MYIENDKITFADAVFNAPDMTTASKIENLSLVVSDEVMNDEHKNEAIEYRRVLMAEYLDTETAIQMPTKKVITIHVCPKCGAEHFDGHPSNCANCSIQVSPF